MTESIISGIAVVAFIVFLSASNAIFEMRKLERERKEREMELIRQQEEWLLIQKRKASAKNQSYHRKSKGVYF